MNFHEKALGILGQIGPNGRNLAMLEESVGQIVPFVGAGMSVDFGYPTWRDLLERYSTSAGKSVRVKRLLQKAKFEEAAEVCTKLRNAFDDFLFSTFDHKKLSRPLRRGAVRYLPRIARGPVLTTNFDRVLELTFEDAGGSFQAVFPGTHIREASRAVQLNQRCLLKLHGDYLDSASRVLSLSEYAREYGSPTQNIDLALPLPRVLGQALGARALLFLGCSLGADRTTLLAASIARKLPGTVHFAVLSAGECTAERRRQLDEWNIRPLYYPAGEYHKIEEFLGCLAETVSPNTLAWSQQRPVPKSPPDGFVPRPKEFRKTKAMLLQPNAHRNVALSTALSGSGGYGKTTLAQALCADPEVEAAYSDAIYWIDVGQSPNILEKLGQLYSELRDSPLPTADEGEASALLAAALRGRRALLVIDDVWYREHLQVFLDAAPDCTHLITTRIVEILDPSVQLVPVDEMSRTEAVQLLLKDISQRPPDLQPVRELAQRLGCWALLLELANRSIRIFMRRRGSTIEAALDFVALEYQNRGLNAFDRRDAKQRNDAAAKSLGLSLEMLETTERSSYLALGVFPEDTSVPVHVAADLWEIDTHAAHSLLLYLDDFSLLKYFAKDKTFRLHDVLYDWVRRQQDMTTLHARLVERWGDPHNLPYEYAWRWIGFHLKGAARIPQLQDLLLEFRWMQAKLKHVALNSLINDYELAAPSEPHRLVQRAITQSSHVVAEQPQQLASQLYGRLLAVRHPTLAPFRLQLQRNMSRLVPLWPALAQADSALLRQLAAGGPVRSLALASDEKTIFAGSEDNIIRKFDIETGRKLSQLEGHTGFVNALALGANQQVLFSGSSDKTIRMWDVHNGRELRCLKGHSESVNALALSANEQVLFSGSSDKTIRIWDVDTGGELRCLEGHSDSVTALVLSPDSRVLVSGAGGGDCTIRVWDPESGREAWRSKYCPFGIRALALSSDASTLFSGARTLQVWSLNTGRALYRVGGVGVKALALSQDGQTLIAGCLDPMVLVWDVASGREPRHIEGHNDSVCAVALTTDGQTAFSGSVDRTIRVWDLGSRQGSLPQGPVGPSWALAFSPDGQTVFAGSGEDIRILDAKTGSELRRLQGHEAWVSALALSNNGRTLFSGSFDGTIRAWDVGTCRELLRWRRHLRGSRNFVDALALTLDDDFLLSGSTDGVIRVWDTRSGRLLRHLKGHTGAVRALRLMMDEQIVASGSEDMTIRLWALRSGRELDRLDGHTDAVTSLDAHELMLASGADDGTFRIWDIRHGRKWASSNAYMGMVRAVALTANGHALISGSDDGSVRVWDLDKGILLDKFYADGPILSLALLGTEKLAAADKAGHIHVFQLHDLPQTGKPRKRAASGKS